MVWESPLSNASENDDRDYKDTDEQDGNWRAFDKVEDALDAIITAKGVQPPVDPMQQNSDSGSPWPKNVDDHESLD